MTTTNTLNIEHFIPSETYKAFLTENHIELSPKQKAKIVYRSNRPRNEKWDGIIHVFPDRKKQISRLLSKGYNPDDEEFVEFMDENGQFEHDHLLVTELEQVELESIPEQQRGVIDEASRLVKGIGSIDEFQYDIIQLHKLKSSLAPKDSDVTPTYWGRDIVDCANSHSI